MLFKDTLKVGDEDGLKEYLGGIQKTMVWQTWKPFVAGAELTYIIPAIGQDLYDELTGTEPLNAYQCELKEKLRRALAWYAYLDAMPSLITATGDAGITMNSPPNTQAMPKWLYVETKKSHQDKADRYMEAALAFLEKNADEFPDWKESDFYTIQNGQLIRSATEATRYFPSIQNSRRLYLTLRPYFNRAEDEFILPVLGDGFYQALLTSQAAGTDSAVTYDGQALVSAKKALVEFGFALAVPFLNMNTDFRLVSETDGIVNENSLSSEWKNAIRNDALAKGQEKLAELKNYLNRVASAEIFPEYFTSALYKPPASGGYERDIPNDPSKPYFVL